MSHCDSEKGRTTEIWTLSPRHETDLSDEVRQSAINSDLVLAAPD